MPRQKRTWARLADAVGARLVGYRPGDHPDWPLTLRFDNGVVIKISSNDPLWYEVTTRAPGRHLPKSSASPPDCADTTRTAEP